MSEDCKKRFPKIAEEQGFSMETGSKRISPEELELILEGLQQFQDGKVSDLDEDDLVDNEEREASE